MQTGAGKDDSVHHQNRASRPHYCAAAASTWRTTLELFSLMPVHTCVTERVPKKVNMVPYVHRNHKAY